MGFNIPLPRNDKKKEEIAGYEFDEEELDLNLSNQEESKEWLASMDQEHDYNKKEDEDKEIEEGMSR